MHRYDTTSTCKLTEQKYSPQLIHLSLLGRSSFFFIKKLGLYSVVVNLAHITTGPSKDRELQTSHWKMKTLHLQIIKKTEMVLMLDKNCILHAQEAKVNR